MVSYKKTDGGSHFVSCYSHFILSFPTSAFSLSSLSFLLRSSNFSQPRLIDYAHPQPPWAGSRIPPYPRYFSIPGDFCFVLLCSHRAPGSILFRFTCFSERHLQLHLGTPWAIYCLERFQSTMPACRRFRSLPERFRAQLLKSPPQQPAAEWFLR